MSFPLTNFRPSWMNSSEPYVGEKVTFISIEEIGKRKKMKKKVKMEILIINYFQIGMETLLLRNF